MASSPDLPPGRFRGVLVWIDDEARRVRHAPLTRAILRGDGLKMELTCDGRPYDVSLRRGSENAYTGEWSRSLPEGRLKGEASFWVTAPGDEGQPIALEGSWQEDGRWEWVARLIPLGAPGSE